MAFQQNNRGGWADQRYQAPAIDVSVIRLGENIPTDLFADTAEMLASGIKEEGRGRMNKSAQLRRFYDEIVMWHDKVFVELPENRDGKLQELLPYIRMISAKAAYAKGRELISDGMCELIKKLVGQICSPLTLRQAKLFFEAFLGFTKALELNNK